MKKIYFLLAIISFFVITGCVPQPTNINENQNVNENININESTNLNTTSSTSSQSYDPHKYSSYCLALVGVSDEKKEKDIADVIEYDYIAQVIEDEGGTDNLKGICKLINDSFILYFSLNNDEWINGEYGPEGDPNQRIIRTDSRFNKTTVDLVVGHAGDYNLCQVIGWPFTHYITNFQNTLLIKCASGDAGYHNEQIYKWNIETNDLTTLRKCVTWNTYDNDLNLIDSEKKCEVDQIDFSPYVSAQPYN